jgi:hypothetical protein
VCEVNPEPDLPSDDAAGNEGTEGVAETRDERTSNLGGSVQTGWNVRRLTPRAAPTTITGRRPKRSVSICTKYGTLARGQRDPGTMVEDFT